MSWLLAVGKCTMATCAESDVIGAGHEACLANGTILFRLGDHLMAQL